MQQKLVYSALCLLMALISSVVRAEPNACGDMYGTYSVITFNNALGLEQAAKLSKIPAPLGKPYFKVQHSHNADWHKGLIRNTRHTITLKEETVGQEWLDSLVKAPITRCSYNIKSSPIYYNQVNLSKLSNKQLHILLNYMQTSWSKMILENGTEEDLKAASEATSTEEPQLSLASLKKIKYFVIRPQSDYYVVIPLTKSN